MAGAALIMMIWFSRIVLSVTTLSCSGDQGGQLAESSPWIGGGRSSRRLAMGHRRRGRPEPIIGVVEVEETGGVGKVAAH